jgi:hypothetical protein
MDYPIISDDPGVQASYVEMREAGEPHNAAEMFALRAAPALMTDAVFLEGHHSGNQFSRTPAVGEYYKRTAEAQGQTTEGKVYLSQLAAYPGDPKAWVSGRGDAERVLKERGWGSEGAVTAKVTNTAQADQKYKVSEDLVKAGVAKELEGVNALDADVPALTEQVREKMSPNWS